MMLKTRIFSKLLATDELIKQTGWQKWKDEDT